MFVDQPILDAIDGYKQELIRQQPVADFNLFEHIRKQYIISLSFSSNALDNCTYSLVETKILLENGTTPPEARPARDVFALFGHARACNYIFDHSKDASITEKDVKALHCKLQNGLESEDTLGVYRTTDIESDTNKFSAAPVDAIPELLQKLFTEINEDNMHSVERAFHFHNEIMYIQPFFSGNAKLARLGMNMLLLERNFFPVEIPCHYQDEYFGAFAKDPMDRRALFNILARCEMEAQRSMMRFFFPDDELKKRQEKIQKQKAKPRYDYTNRAHQA